MAVSPRFEEFYDNDGYLIRTQVKFGKKKDMGFTRFNNDFYVHLGDYSKCWETGTYDKAKFRSVSLSWAELGVYRTLIGQLFRYRDQILKEESSKVPLRQLDAYAKPEVNVAPARGTPQGQSLLTGKERDGIQNVPPIPVDAVVARPIPVRTGWYSMGLPNAEQSDYPMGVPPPSGAEPAEVDLYGRQQSSTATISCRTREPLTQLPGNGEYYSFD